ncbi:hypothetical protein BASA81_006098 [Batrachochytrium salamandrivorans]|nr:hypothetical protein BASA81_006098 [Batrachochytrium salamandrivorans]
MSAKESEQFKLKGNAYLASGEYQKASDMYTKAIKLAPTSHILYSNRSAVKIQLTDFAGALEDAKKCVELDGSWAKGYSRLGAAYAALNKHDESLAAYTQGLTLDPSNAALAQGKASAAELKATADANKVDLDYNPDVDPIIGIDLGTTFSCVGVWQNDGVTIIPDAEGRLTTPSVVSYSTNEAGEVERLVGYDAKRKMTTNAEGTIYDAKRIIGQRFNDEQVKRDVEKLTFKVEAGAGDDKPRIVIPSLKLQFTPEEISAVILSEMKKIAEKHLEREVTKAIVTVPAYFSDAQRQATKDAGAIAGLNVLRVINEPTAAALAYGLDSRSHNLEDGGKSESKILVFDLGGGTFDVSVLTIENGVFEVMSTGGDTHLGGEDFDNATSEHLKREIKHKYKVDVDLKKKARLRVAAEKAKIALSNATSTKVELDGIIDGENQFIELTREAFDKINEEPFKRCMETVKRVLKDAKLKPEQIRDVVLVGGSTRIPTIRDRLSDYFGGKKLCQSINPDEAVAYGAAVQGAIMNRASASTSQLILVDVTPLSLGIECAGKVFSVVIPRNTALPVKRTKTYSTEEDYQTEIDVRIFEGERQVVDGNNLLGEFRISGIERAKRGVPQVEVTFAVSVDGILQVSAIDTKTRASGNVSIAANSGRLSKDDIASMLANAEKFRKQDEERMARLEAVNELDHMLSEIAESKAVGKSVRARANKVQEWFDEQGGRETATLVELKARMAEIYGHD